MVDYKTEYIIKLKKQIIKKYMYKFYDDILNNALEIDYDNLINYIIIYKYPYSNSKYYYIQSNLNICKNQLEYYKTYTLSKSYNRYLITSNIIKIPNNLFNEYYIDIIGYYDEIQTPENLILSYNIIYEEDKVKMYNNLKLYIMKGILERISVDELLIEYLINSLKILIITF